MPVMPVMLSQHRITLNCFELIDKKMSVCKIIDSMDIIYIVTSNFGVNESRHVLSQILEHDCKLDLPMNLKLQIKYILENDGLLESISKYFNIITK